MRRAAPGAVELIRSNGGLRPPVDPGARQTYAHALDSPGAVLATWARQGPRLGPDKGRVSALVVSSCFFGKGGGSDGLVFLPPVAGWWRSERGPRWTATPDRAAGRRARSLRRRKQRPLFLGVAKAFCKVCGSPRGVNGNDVPTVPAGPDAATAAGSSGVGSGRALGAPCERPGGRLGSRGVLRAVQRGTGGATRPTIRG